MKQLVNAVAALAAPASSDTMGMVACNAGSTPLHLAAMKVGCRDNGAGINKICITAYAVAWCCVP